MEQDGLPVYSGPVDHLRQGFNSLESEMLSQHPVCSQRKLGQLNWNNKLDMVRRNYGSHMVMRLETERSIFNHPHRVRGLESSSISLQTVLNEDNSISFEDYLDVPNMRPDMPKLQVHSQMEIALGLL